MKRFMSLFLSILITLTVLPMIVYTEGTAGENNVNADEIKSIGAWVSCGYSQTHTEDVLCIELDGKYTQAGTPDISIRYISEEDGDPIKYSYTADEMIINYPSEETGNALEIFLCSPYAGLLNKSSDDIYLEDSGAVELYIGENSFVGSGGGNQTIEYEISYQSVEIIDFDYSISWESPAGEERDIYYSNCKGDYYVVRTKISEKWRQRMTSTVSDDSKFQFISSDYSEGSLCEKYLALDVGEATVSCELNDFIGFTFRENITTRSNIYFDNLGTSALAVAAMPVFLALGAVFMAVPVLGWLPGFATIGAALGAIPTFVKALFGVITYQ